MSKLSDKDVKTLTRPACKRTSYCFVETPFNVRKIAGVFLINYNLTESLRNFTFYLPYICGHLRRFCRLLWNVQWKLEEYSRCLQKKAATNRQISINNTVTGSEYVVSQSTVVQNELYQRAVQACRDRKF